MAYSGGGGDARLQQTQREVDEVVNVMRNNVSKVLERDQKLGDLDERANNLEANSISFARSSNQLKKKMWWENLKMKLIIGGIVLAILIIIITIIAVKTSGSGSSTDSITKEPES